MIELRDKLKEAVKRNLTDAILLSGGLDTTILAYIASKRVDLRAFTVALKGSEAPDLGYAKLVARHLGLRHRICTFSEDEALRAIPEVVRILKTFDPMEIPNDLAIYFALREARAEGADAVMTGDGADELFAGYSYLFKMGRGELNGYIKRISKSMYFSSVDLGKALGIEVRAPYLDPEFVRFAVEISPESKVKRVRGSTWGKWILRKAFEGIIPVEVAWRAKTPIEIGTGTTTLRHSVESSVSDSVFESRAKRYLQSDGVKIRSKEQLYYYGIFRSLFGVPQLVSSKSWSKQCPFCRSGIPNNSTYCRTCGAIINREE